MDSGGLYLRAVFPTSFRWRSVVRALVMSTAGGYGETAKCFLLQSTIGLCTRFVDNWVSAKFSGIELQVIRLEQ